MLFVSIIKIRFNWAVKFHLQPHLNDWARHEIFPQCQTVCTVASGGASRLSRRKWKQNPSRITGNWEQNSSNFVVPRSLIHCWSSRSRLRQVKLAKENPLFSSPAFLAMRCKQFCDETLIYPGAEKLLSFCRNLKVHSLLGLHRQLLS